MTVGYECKARFFIAGGVFKTLLTGKQPRDVDFWPPSQRARKVLIDCLLQKGATHVKEGMYNDIFTIRDLTVEVAKKCEPETLDARLKRFDIALSAIGVEFTPGGNWDVRIHPLAKTTIKERRILLLKPLVNWKHSLASLERMRRYSQELGYESPTEEENEIWDVFDSQDFEMQRGMISRFKNSTKGNFGVYEQAIRRVECR
ncbi:MAG: hypothetical protein U5N86_05205 [Planctomycetota bacterium]|nr:hypothetical protein [Planctomycetota bacterium]